MVIVQVGYQRILPVLIFQVLQKKHNVVLIFSCQSFVVVLAQVLLKVLVALVWVKMQ